MSMGTWINPPDLVGFDDVLAPAGGNSSDFPASLVFCFKLTEVLVVRPLSCPPGLWMFGVVLRGGIGPRETEDDGFCLLPSFAPATPSSGSYSLISWTPEVRSRSRWPFVTVRVGTELVTNGTWGFVFFTRGKGFELDGAGNTAWWLWLWPLAVFLRTLKSSWAVRLSGEF